MEISLPFFGRLSLNSLRNSVKRVSVESSNGVICLCLRQIEFSGPVEASASIQWTRMCLVDSVSEVWLFEG